MRALRKLLKWAVLLLIVAIFGVAGWLHFMPPDLIRVGAAYSAKIVCSNVFIAGRDPSDVLEVDVQAPGHPILRFMNVEVDRAAGTVSAGLFGLFGKGLAMMRAGTGCANVPDGDLVAARRFQTNPAPLQAADAALSEAPWPAGRAVEEDPRLTAILDDTSLTGPGMRAVVVVHDGRIVGERYGDGFSVQRPLLGWSMTKTVNAAIVGTVLARNALTRETNRLFDAWKDGRAEITLANLMAMSSGLAFNEEYGDVTDVTRMLFLEPDMAAYARASPLTGEVGEAFSYSSGTSVLLSRIWQDAVGDEAQSLAWPRETLFGPLGMDSAVLEADARGTFVGSSYLYATAQDWARFALFLLRDGQWNGGRILPEGFVEWMREPAPASKGDYGRGQLWLHGPSGGTPEGEDPDAGFDLPRDTFWMLGHDGQSAAIIPSTGTAVIRMGLTPSKLGYKPQGLVEAVVKALE